MTGPPQNGIYSTRGQQIPASAANSNANVQQPSASQQPVQFQNIAGPGQITIPFSGNPQPLYYIGNPNPPQGYPQDPVKMAYSTLPMQPYAMQQYPTSTIPQIYGGNYSTPQQVCPIHVLLQIVLLICCTLVCDDAY